jgi:hypothetical protein
MINAILRMYQGITVNDFLLQDDGDSPYIKQWNWKEPKPDINDVIAESLKVIPPSIVSMRQARLALLQSGLLSTVSAAIAAGGEADQIEWEYAAEVNRNQPLVQNMKAGLGLTDADLDNLFTLAASL